MAKTTSYPVTRILGFCDAARQMLNVHQTQMIAAGVNPGALMALLPTQLDDLNAKNTVQESLKTQLRERTVLVDAAKGVAYATASQACDRMISAFGRTSEEGKEAIRLRRSLRLVRRASKTAAATP